MGKKWDYDVPSVELWQECLRVLKPGGHLLAACGTRTQHRMATNIEDAGFEIRDLIAWIYGSGFPKSLNITLNLAKQIDNKYNYKTSLTIWKNINLSNVKSVAKTLKKSQIEIGTNTPKKDSVQDNAMEYSSIIKPTANVLIVVKNLKEVNPISKQESFVANNVEQNIQQQNVNVKSAGLILSRKIRKSKKRLIITVGMNVKEWLKEKINQTIKDEEAQMIWLGRMLSLKEMDLNAKCAVLIENLKHIILKELKTSQSLDTILTMDLHTVTTVITTKSIMECLIISTASILKEKAKLFEGWGTALKPAMELWTMARKPISEKNIAENVLRWHTGGINIDGCRVPTDENWTTNGNIPSDSGMWKKKRIDQQSSPLGRFPANLIHDGSEEVVAGFPEVDSGGKKTTDKSNVKGMFGYGGINAYDRSSDSGSASRFFYTAKAHSSERNYGLEGFEEKGIDINSPHNSKDLEERYGMTAKNHHPTVKSLELMKYLVRLVTPKGGVCLDAFMGSGTTGMACKLEHFDFIGIELETEYFNIAKARIDAVGEVTEIKQTNGKLF